MKIIINLNTFNQIISNAIIINFAKKKAAPKFINRRIQQKNLMIHHLKKTN